MVGLDAGGKTSILSQLQYGRCEVTVPTIGLNEAKVRHGNFKLKVYDIGGKEDLRPLWGLYYRGMDALVFVVDSNDRTRLSEARREFQKLLTAEDLKDAAILVFANKQDAVGALSALEIAHILGLVNVMHRPWHVAPCITLSGEGITAGMNWLTEELSASRSYKIQEDYWERQSYQVEVDTSIFELLTPRSLKPSLPTVRPLETGLKTPRSLEPSLQTPRSVEPSLLTPR